MYDFSSHFDDYSEQNKLKYLFYYLIGNLYFKSESFSRTNFFHLRHSFIVSDEVYSLTGIYSISFDYCDEKGDYDKLLIENKYDYDNLVDILGDNITDDLLRFNADTSFDVRNITHLNLSGDPVVFKNFRILFSSILTRDDIHFDLLEK